MDIYCMSLVVGILYQQANQVKCCQSQLHGILQNNRVNSSQQGKQGGFEQCERIIKNSHNWNVAI